MIKRLVAVVLLVGLAGALPGCKSYLDPSVPHPRDYEQWP
jgi:hypothetical protein